MTDNTNPIQRHSVLFHGKSGEYFSIWLTNAFLTILTLGIYSAWATVRRRRYFYGNTEIAGDRFDYHARPIDLLKGRILVMVGIVVFFILSAVLPTISSLFLLALFALLPWVIIRSWRYNALMTSYRGVRFNYHCQTGRAYWVMYLCPLLLLLAVYVPVGLMVWAVGNMAASAGSMTMVVIGGLLALLMLVVGGAVVSGIMAAMTHDLYVNNMQYGRQGFRATLSKKKYIKMAFISILIMLPFFLFAAIKVSATMASLFYSSLNGGDDAMMQSVALQGFSSLILAYIIVLIGAMVSFAWLTVMQRNYLYQQTRVGDKVQLKSDLKVIPYLLLLLTNTLIVIFTLGFGTPVAEVRLARYLAQSTALEGDMSLSDVHAHQDSAGTAVAEEMVQAFDLNVGI
ncbi:YjgN family protein [Erwiniaceae bacterium BAC15a-03b]|uniref:YjgN family protein n=1 Tax=Winslowiella arboricola TaxID=2978220 RepID=A0A9J6PM31_9GAMM|nr:DUF898 family protein [Winslowiella arboricola]MCU5773659.1 YjgN family protein [Winslowiella arboricola]MCU5778442.1 YjgN family protein [Winslowiella arboricola]